MGDLSSELIKLLCTEVGQGHTNTHNLTEQVLLSNPGGDYNRVKIEVVETLKELIEDGQIQIVTMGWELGQEFLFICAKRS